MPKRGGEKRFEKPAGPSVRVLFADEFEGSSLNRVRVEK
jgi:hypothetical protein